MKAKDIMTADVITIRPDTTVREVAKLMTEKHISGVPVVDAEGRLLGLLSQSDLLHRQELGTETRRKWWLHVFADPDRLAMEYTKSHGLKAGDIMSKHIISVSPETELADVAAILDKNRIKRVPVMANGALVGIVTRTDLVKALQHTQPTRTSVAPDDATLQQTLTGRMKEQPWLNATYISTVVDDGKVTLSGHVASAAQHRALRVLVEETAGVSAIDDHLHVGRLPVAIT